MKYTRIKVVSDKVLAGMMGSLCLTALAINGVISGEYAAYGIIGFVLLANGVNIFLTRMFHK